MTRWSAVARVVLTLAVIAVAAGSLSACGRKGKPVGPDGASYDLPYPRS